MDNDKYQALMLENQLCFPLYACSKEIIRKYKPFLDDLDLTYTQYIAMLVLWENEEMSVKELGGKLLLDSGTLTPLLKKLEAKGYITRRRSARDERNLIVTMTDEGRSLRDRAVEVPKGMRTCVVLTEKESKELYRLLYKVIDGFDV